MTFIKKECMCVSWCSAREAEVPSKIRSRTLSSELKVIPLHSVPLLLPWLHFGLASLHGLLSASSLPMGLDLGRRDTRTGRSPPQVATSPLNSHAQRNPCSSSASSFLVLRFCPRKASFCPRGYCFCYALVFDIFCCRNQLHVP